MSESCSIKSRIHSLWFHSRMSRSPWLLHLLRRPRSQRGSTVPEIFSRSSAMQEAAVGLISGLVESEGRSEVLVVAAGGNWGR